MEQTQLEQQIGYHFQNRALLDMALCHSSYANEHKIPRSKNNERLEYLGDAVLELVVSDFLYHTKEDVPEGKLTRLRASIVCEPTLYLCAKQFDLGAYLYLGKGEDATGGRKRPSIVSDAMEALIGAIYLDGGFTSAKEFIHRFILQNIDHLQLFFDSKTILQELIQQLYHTEVTYEELGESGPDHNKTFDVQVLQGGQILAKGSGHTKKAAEQEAAYQAILKIKREKGTDVQVDTCI